MSLILSYNHQILNYFYILGGMTIVPYWLINSIKICPIIPNRYQSHSIVFIHVPGIYRPVSQLEYISHTHGIMVWHR